MISTALKCTENWSINSYVLLWLFFPLGFDNLSHNSGKDMICGRIKCCITNCWRVCVFCPKVSNQTPGLSKPLQFFTVPKYSFFFVLEADFYCLSSVLSWILPLSSCFLSVALFCGLNFVNDIVSYKLFLKELICQ